MKSIACKIVAALMLVGALAGCATVEQESAMDWMQKQPRPIDP